MAKKDFSSAVQGMVKANISPVQNLLGVKSDDVTEIVEETKQIVDEKPKKKTKNTSQLGRPVGTTKPLAEKRTNAIVHYFSDNELKNIEIAGISQGELSTILRLRLKEMGVNISIK